MDRALRVGMLDPFIENLRSFEFGGCGLDVREKAVLEGRPEQTRFVHQNFPSSDCAIAVEFKKVLNG